MQPQPMLIVHDVPATSRFYQKLLGCTSGHGGDEYERLLDRDGKLFMQLHRWEAHEHPHMGDPKKPVGNGALIWFQIDDFDAALGRVKASGAVILDGPKVNPNARHREIWVRDPNGYVVVLAGRMGDV